MAAGKPAWYGEGTERSDLDAMGNEKRRSVVGRRYGASPGKRLLVYGIAVLVLVLVVVAFLTVITSVDQRDIALEETAPWAADDATLMPPRPVDYMRNGPLNTIPVDEIVNR